MTTLAIIGSGIMGRSLLYSLAKEQNQFERVILLSAEEVTIPCSLNSTAVAAQRGTVKGLSSLGDLLVDGFSTLRSHICTDAPAGVEKIFQFSAATEKLDSFSRRHPNAKLSERFFRQPMLLDQEEAYVFEPGTYLSWLLDESKRIFKGKLEIVTDLVVELTEGEKIALRTLNGRSFEADHVVVAGGSYNRFWKELAPQTKLKSSKPVPGSYLEYTNVDWKNESFSLTVNGHNVVWNKPFGKLLIGSTTTEELHYLPDLGELRRIHSELSDLTTLPLPSFAEHAVKTGLREKAQRREPYLVSVGKLHFLGGLYKNAFSVSLHLANSFIRQSLLSS